MKRKLLLIPLSLAIFTVVIYFNKGNQTEEKSLAHHTLSSVDNMDKLWPSPHRSYTPDELKALEKARKALKRRQGYVKYDKPDEYAKFFEETRTRANEVAPGYDPNYKLVELQKAKENLVNLKSDPKFQGFGINEEEAKYTFSSDEISADAWVERGPANVPGRTRGIIAHPDDAENIWFAGSVGGGIWKTTNAGQTWVNKTPNLPNLATTVLALAESNTSVIYCGTGEGFYNSDAINGDGIFKSTDKGETWEQLESTKNNDFANVNRIIVDPNNENVLLACTNTGNALVNQDPAESKILRSTDGGASWEVVYEEPNGRRVQDLVADPTDFNIQYAGVNGVGVMKSVNGGVDWSPTGFMNPSGRIELAISPVNTSRILASCEGGNTGSGSDVFVSNNSGDDWKLVVEDANGYNGGQNPGYLGGQGWYDNIIAAHPFDEDIFYVGGISIWKMELTGQDVGQVNMFEGILENTESFLGFVNFGGSLFSGGMALGPEVGFANLQPDEYLPIEIRFGQGASQKAHRFDGGTGGTAFNTYVYMDYVDVPFEVWDTENNVQLMVSFRDTDEADYPMNGIFDLIPYPPCREYPLGVFKNL